MVGAVPDGPLNIGKLKEWTEKSNLDPNDPQNSILFHFLQQAKDCESADISFFRLDPFQDEFDFCSLSDLANNPRLKLLNLRDSGEPEFRGIKMVPLGENQIHREVFRVSIRAGMAKLLRLGLNFCSYFFNISTMLVKIAYLHQY